MRVLIRYDVDGWAFHKRALGLKRYHPEGWEVVIAPDSRVPESTRWDIALMLDAQADSLMYQNSRVIRHVGSHAWMYDKSEDWRSRGVNPNRCYKRAHDIASGVHAVGVYNTAQQRFFSKYHNNIILSPYCPDLALFTRDDRKPNDKLRVGWCQQVSGGLNSFKGLSDVLVPIVATVGNAVDWSVLTPEAKACLATDELVCWYQSIDIFLCTSSAEGGPHGPFEASACGAAVLSTNVGQVADWKIEGKFIDYKDREEADEVVREMASTILHFANNRELLPEFAMRQRQILVESFNPAVEYPKHLEAMVA